MFNSNHILISKKLFIGLFALFAQVVANAQEESVINNKGTIIKVRNNVVTTAAAAPTSPLQNDVWFDTTANTTKIYNGSVWLEIDYDAVITSATTPLDPKSGAIWIDTSDTDNQIIKAWDSSAWVELTFTGITGSIFFADTDGKPTQNNAQFFWDNSSNRLGIGTTGPVAQIDIESTGVPLRVKPSTSTPTGNSGGQMFVGNDGILYIYDGTRSKWLSVDRTMVGWGRSSGNTTNEYLRQFNGSPSNNNGWRMIRDGTITGITAQSNAVESWTLEIRKNDSATVITSLTMAAQNGNHNKTLNVDVNEGDFLQAYCNGTSVAHPQSLIEIAWRK